jgi:hypothetical protein
MSKSRVDIRTSLTVAVVVVVAALELFVRKAPDGTFLVALTYFTMAVQGCVALAAVGELTKGVWLIPVKQRLLGVYPLLFFAALLSLVLAVKMDIYRWAGHPNGWLNRPFFIIRNFVVLLAVFLIARRFAIAVRRGSAEKNRWAALYIALFIVSQSFVAFDWIMSLEYPWVSTLLGGFFFVESFLMALAVSALILLFMMRGPAHGLTETLRDTSKMMFGFSVMWVGFFFAQFLVIWYGNIPEEVGVVLERVSRPPFAALSRAVIFLVWVIPFVILLSRPLKTVPRVMAGVGILILTGLFVEKLVLVLPAASVSVTFLLIETLLLLVSFTLYICRGSQLIAKQDVAEHDEAVGQ